MAKGKKKFTMDIPIPVKGINMAVSPEKLALDQAFELFGWEFTEYGVLGAPYNHNDIGQIAAANPLSAHIFQREGGSTQLIVHMDDGTLRYSTDFLVQHITTSWTTIASGLSTSAPFSFETFLDTVWMSNGVDDYRKWDGTTQTTYPALPKVKYLRVWRDTMWGAVTAGNTDRVYSSAPGDATTWPGTNFVDIEKGRGFGISGLGATGASLVIFKFSRHFQLYDPVDYLNRLVDDTKGALSHTSIVSHQGQLYFVSHLGVCRYLGDGPAEIVSDAISPLFDFIVRANTSYATFPRNPAGDTQIWGYSYMDRVGWGFLMSTSSQGEQFQYYPSLPGSPWIRQGFPGGTHVLQIAVREKGNFQRLYAIGKIGGGSQGKLYRMNDPANADQTPVDTSWATPWIDLDTPLVEKYLDFINITKRGKIRVLVRTNYDMATSTVLLDAAADSDDIHMTEKPLYCDVYGRVFQFVFIATTSPGAEDKQWMSSGVPSEDEIARYRAGIANVKIHGTMLGEYRR